jgi:hypothetical protein
VPVRLRLLVEVAPLERNPLGNVQEPLSHELMLGRNSDLMMDIRVHSEPCLLESPRKSV